MANEMTWVGVGMRNRNEKRFFIPIPSFNVQNTPFFFFFFWKDTKHTLNAYAKFEVSH